mmetsp:Transcript_6892/g.21459  ORF Transcript_6892/g.21459 Transcript_6892/m.21459 type:complete len:312 (+) Transcript_6892:108-1043(+)
MRIVVVVVQVYFYRLEEKKFPSKPPTPPLALLLLLLLIFSPATISPSSSSSKNPSSPSSYDTLALFTLTISLSLFEIVRNALLTPYFCNSSLATIPRYCFASSRFSGLPSSSNSLNCASVNPPLSSVPLRATRKSNHEPNESYAKVPSAFTSCPVGNGINRSIFFKRDGRFSINRSNFEVMADIRRLGIFFVNNLANSQPAWSFASKIAHASGSLIFASFARLHALSDSLLAVKSFRNFCTPASVRKLLKHNCKYIIPNEYMSNLSGKFNCHNTGESAKAIGGNGASGVCVLMMYCSGAAYLGSNMNCFGT